jgi:hypothetical protein
MYSYTWGSVEQHSDQFMHWTVLGYLAMYQVGLEIREYVRRDLSRWPRGALYPQMLTPTSPTSGGLSVGIVRLRTKATE